MVRINKGMIPHKTALGTINWSVLGTTNLAISLLFQIFTHLFSHIGLKASYVLGPSYPVTQLKANFCLFQQRVVFKEENFFSFILDKGDKAMQVRNFEYYLILSAKLPRHARAGKPKDFARGRQVNSKSNYQSMQNICSSNI